MTTVPHQKSSGNSSGGKHEKVSSKESKKSKYDPRVDLAFGVETAFMAKNPSSHKSGKDDSKKQSSKGNSNSVRRVQYVSVNSDSSDDKMFKSFTKNASKKISAMKANKALIKAKSSDKQHRGKR